MLKELFLHIEGIFVKDKALKDEMAKLVAVCIYSDSIIRKDEAVKGLSILDEIFNGEDYEYLEREVNLFLSKFKENNLYYIKKRSEAIAFVGSHEDEKEELLSIVSQIFRADEEVHELEVQQLLLFKKR